MKASLLFSLIVLTLTSCAQEPTLDFSSLVSKQPQLLSISPEGQSILEPPVKFTLHFSERMNLADIHEHSVALLAGLLSPDLQEDGLELLKTLQAEELMQVPLRYELEGDEKTLHIMPVKPLEQGLFTLVLTPALRSIEGVPFNQTPGEGPLPYWASYGVGVDIHLLPHGGESPEAEPSYGEPPQFLVLNEILYDGVHSETDGEAFIEIYGTPGADISDYQIDLINGANGETLKTLHLPMGSTLPESGLFILADLQTNTSDQTRVSPFDHLDHFDPQNGPDALHLKGRDGTLLDALTYGEGAVESTPGGLALGEGSPAADAGPGKSLSRSGGMDTDENFVDFKILDTPSPGVL